MFMKGSVFRKYYFIYGHFIGGPRATTGHRKYSGKNWKNFTSDHSFKVSIYSQNLLGHKAALLFITHTVHLCT